MIIASFFEKFKLTSVDPSYDGFLQGVLNLILEDHPEEPSMRLMEPPPGDWIKNLPRILLVLLVG